MMIQPGTVINQRYTIIEKIGIGGMAVVYRAKDEKLDRFVTFKVLKEEHTSDEQFVKRFDVEARAAARLAHPNIVNVYDVGRQDLIHYIVMEYIDGMTLKELINKRAPFENKEILGISIQIAAALEHAHKNNIVHRDIKPQNILVTKNGTVKVTDFGIARATSSSTLTTDSVGSVHYFSPEQARGGFVDAKSDIYSLGIVMYEMATGNLPFDGDSAVSLAYKHINDRLPDMDEFNHTLSASIKNIVLKATEKNTFNRYKDAASLNSDLKRALTNEAGDFVTKSGNFMDSPTITITDEDLSVIRSNNPEEIIESSEDDEDYEYEDRLKAKERNVIIAAVVTAFALIALITSIGVYYIRNKVNPKIPVPYLVDMSFEEALALTDSLEIYLDKVEEYSDDTPEGYIISQNLEENEIIYKGETISVTVSLGTDKVEVPNVVNKEISDAYSYFEGLDLEVGTPAYEYSDTVTKNVVISQKPEASEMVEKGAVVTLTVSMGKQVTTVIVPKVEGLSESDAKNLLISSHLTVGAITLAESDKVDKGYVITQGISPGAKAEAGSIVRLVVSSGKPVQTAAATPAPVKKKKTLTIDPPVLPEDRDTFNVRIIKINSSHVAEEFYSKEHTKDDFPLKLEVTGEGLVEFQMEIDGAMSGSETVDFSSGE